MITIDSAKDHGYKEDRPVITVVHQFQKEQLIHIAVEAIERYGFDVIEAYVFNHQGYGVVSRMCALQKESVNLINEQVATIKTIRKELEDAYRALSAKVGAPTNTPGDFIVVNAQTDYSAQSCKSLETAIKKAGEAAMLTDNRHFVAKVVASVVVQSETKVTRFD